MSNVRGMVCAPNVYWPHEAPAQLPIQSAQSGSCSAPNTRSPPCLTGAVVVVPPPAAELLFLLLPHAAATSASATSAPASALPFLMSRTVWRPPFLPVNEVWMSVGYEHG